MKEERLYKYSAMNAMGTDVKGEISGTDENDVNSKLKKVGLFPTSITKAGAKPVENNIREPRLIFSFSILGFRFTLERV